MKLLSKYIIILLAAATAMGASAQKSVRQMKERKPATSTSAKAPKTTGPVVRNAKPQGTTPVKTQGSSATITRRSAGDSAPRRGLQSQEGATPGVTERMAQRFAQPQTADADRQWMRVIYRALDLKDPKNASLYYPEEIINGQENLFRIIMRLIANGQLPAYEYLDGKEIFTDQYRLKVRDMLDRFHVLYTDAKGSTEKSPRFTIEESDVPTNEVLSYYLLEKYDFDSRTNKTHRRVEAICPVLHRSDDFGGEPVRYPMFWVKMDALRPYLAQQYIFIDDDNNLPRYTYADFFNLAMYKGDIYKTRNLTNKSLMQQFPDPDDLKRAQDSIQNRLDNFDKHLWVPSREELAAAREAREASEAAAAAASEIPSRDAKPSSSSSSEKSEKKSVRSSRAKKSSSPKVSKPSSPKSSSAPVRSVRRRR